MLLKLLLFADVLIYAFVASQHLFYIMGLTMVQRKMSPAAYIEIRHLLDRKLDTRLRLSYYAALTISLITLVTSCFYGSITLIIATAMAFICVTLDVLLAVKFNIPLNKIINQWQPASYPSKWKLVQAKWFYYYSIRQYIGLTGFVSLIAGVLFKR